jgi:hypothetical protein
MRIAALCLTLVIAWVPTLSLAQSPAPPTAKVTFYSSGSMWKASIPFYKHGQFAGRIMDGDKQLAMLRPGKFVTFNLDPGEHTLAANSWMIASPVAGGRLKIKLEPGQHYYVGAYIETVNIVTIFRLEEHTCEKAQLDNKTTKPLKTEHIKDYGRPREATETVFPPCAPVTP